MDWTGGTRRRFAAGKNNATTQKQKAHFAKARVALRTVTRKDKRSQSQGIPLCSELSELAAARSGDILDSDQLHHRLELGDLGDCTQKFLKYGHGELSSRGKIHAGVRKICVHQQGSKILELSNQPSEKEIRSAGNSHSIGRTHSHLASSAADEERLLLARRRNLLARPDWLGLTLLRPAKRESASPSQGSRDKKLVGRRRKVRRTRRNSENAGRLPVLRSLEPMPRFQDDITSGFGIDNVQIKIGTDAFTTQMRDSGRSMLSGNTSMRPPPTSLSLLSEESMLLGPEDNSFDLARVSLDSSNLTHELAAGPGVHEDRPATVELYGMADKDRSPGYRGFDQKEGSRELGMHSHPNVLVPASSSESVWPLMYRSHNSGTIHQVEQVKEQETCRGEFAERNVNDEDQEILDEDLWRKFIEVRMDPISHTSIAAVNSSSSHGTNSDNRPRGRLVFDVHTIDEGSEMPVLATPPGDGTQESSLAARDTPGSTDSVSEAVQGSPALSLQRITALATAPVVPIQNKQEEASEHDNELWRTFIIGSEPNSFESPPPCVPNFEDSSFTVGMRSPVVPLLSEMVSGLGTSIAYAEGGFEGQSDDEKSCHVFEHRRRTKDSASAHKSRSSDPRLQIQCANVAKHTKGEQDQARGKARCRAPQTNIHAGTHTDIRSKGLKNRQIRRQFVHGVSNEHFELNKVIKEKQIKQVNPNMQRSIYDLVDSDGVSLA